MLEPTRRRGYYPLFVFLALFAWAQASWAESRIISVETVDSSGHAVVGGSVVPFKEVTLTAQMPGRVEFVAGEEGDGFDAGALLVALDDDELLARRQAALAQMQNAEASMRNAQMQFNREIYSPQSRNIGRMPGMGVPSMFDQMFTRNFGDAMGMGDPTVDRQADLYSRGTGVDQAYAAILQARSQLEELDATIRDTRSVAPFDGVIMSKQVEVGDTVQPGQPLVVFAHTRFLRIQAEIPARLVSQLSVGMLVDAELDVGPTEVQARVSQIYPMANPQQHTVTVKFDLPEGVPGGPGMYAEVLIPDQRTGQRPQVLIPATAVLAGRSLPRVLVVDQRGRSSMRVVRLGSRQGDKIVVLSGLSAGDRIIDSPPAGASSGWMPGGG
jgi:multidrug efflux pump subunit AcrA (membrane-fusion protein)